MNGLVVWVRLAALGLLLAGTAVVVQHAGAESAAAAQQQGAGAAQQAGAEGTGQAASAELARSVARDPVLEARATRLASELRCPVCQGLSIQDSPSPLALQMKDLIRTQVGQGQTDAEIRGYFVSKYGEWVLLEPRAEGFNLLVYLLPAVALLAGLGLLFVAVRRWTAPPDEPAEEGAGRA